MPFCPSLPPWKKETSVQVRMSSPRIHRGGGRIALRRLVEVPAAHREFQGEQQQGRQHEAADRREQQRLEDVARLAPVDARGAVAAVHQLVGEADAQDRADQRVGRGVRQAEGPGPEIPEDGREEQREDHRVAGSRSDVQDQLHRQQRHDGVGHRARGEHHAEEVEEARPDHRHERRHRARVDHRGDRVGGVVESVDEFEGQRDQQGEPQQGEGAVRQRCFADGVHVGDQAHHRVAEPCHQDEQEGDEAPQRHPVVEPRAALRSPPRNPRRHHGGIGHEASRADF